MKRFHKITAWTIGTLLFFLVTAVILIHLLFDPNDYRDEIAAIVKKQTGRDLVIKGDLELSLFPWLGVESGAVEFSNAPGFGPEPFLQFNEAKLKVKLLPLLRMNVELSTIELAGLRLHLARDRDGRTNWEDLTKASEQKEAEPEKREEEKAKGPGISSLSLEGLVISDAKVTWDDKAKGKRSELLNLNLTTGALDLHSPFSFVLESDFLLTPPETAGHLQAKGTLQYDLDAKRYAMDDLAVALTAHGALVPGNAVSATLNGNVVADLKQQTAQVKSLRLAAYGIQADLKLSATRILEKAEAQGRFDAEIKDPKVLHQAFADKMPAKMDAGQLAGARFGTTLNLSLEKGTASLPDLTANILGTALAANAAASNLLDKPAVRGAVRIDVKSGEQLLKPFAASLPKSMKPAALTNAHFESNFDADLATEQLKITGTRLNALGVRLTTEVQGATILTKPNFTGRIDIAEFVPRDVVAKLGIALPPMADNSTLTKASLSAGFDAGKDHAALEKLELRLDQSTLKGRIAAQRFSPLALRYDLTLDQIDADRYMAPPLTTESKAPPAATAAATAPMKLPTSMLRSLDIEGTVRVGKLKFSNMRSSSALATLRAKNGAFRIHPVSAKLYSGTYSGDLGFDVRGNTPLISMDEHLKGVQVGPLLKDFMGKDYVSGKAELHAKLNARGTEVMAIRQSIGGNASFSFKDGAVNGINIPKLIRDAYAKFKGQPVAKEEPRKTDFSELSGSVSVKDGLVTNKDLSAKSPFLRVDGQGTAHLATQKINYLVTTTIVGRLEGQGGPEASELKGIPIPLQISGTFTEPKFSVPIGEALKQRFSGEVEKKKQELQKKLDVERKKKEEEAKKSIQKGLEQELKKRGLGDLFK